MFLEILQNSQENTCARICFNKPEPCNFIKKESLAQVFSGEFCEIFKNTFFYRTPLDDCFWWYLVTVSQYRFNDDFIFITGVPEAAVCSCSSKYVLLKIFQISQENTCAVVSF